MNAYIGFNVIIIKIFLFLFIIDPSFVICAEFQFTNKSSSERSYILKKFNSVVESKFPAKLKLSFVLSTLNGPLIYSADQNGNVLDINIGSLLSFTGNVLNVKYRGNVRTIDIKQLCNCRKKCLYEKLDLLVLVGDELDIQCNGGTKKTLEYGDKLNKNTKFDKFSTTNQAYLWLWNTPVGMFHSGQDQLVGCILDATYKDEQIEFDNLIGPNVKKGCPRSCKKDSETIIVKAKCIETYSKTKYDCRCFKPEFNESTTISTTGSLTTVSPESKSRTSGLESPLPGCTSGCKLWISLFIIFFILCIVEFMIIILLIMYFKRRINRLTREPSIPLAQIHPDVEALNRPDPPANESDPLLDEINSNNNARYQDDRSFDTIPMEIIGSTDQDTTSSPEIDAAAIEYAKKKIKNLETIYSVPIEDNEKPTEIRKLSDPELDLDDPPDDLEDNDAVAESVTSPSDDITLINIPIKPSQYDLQVKFSPYFANSKQPEFSDYYDRPFDLDKLKHSVTKYLGIDIENIYLMNVSKTVLNIENFYPMDAEMNISYLELKEFKRLEEPVILYEGQYSMVQEYKLDNSNTTRAMKYYKNVLTKDKSIKKIQNVLVEVELFKKCQGHRNIVKFDSLTRIKNESLIISMEMMEGNTLQRYIDEQKKLKGTKLNDEEIKKYLKQILSGLSHIHKNRIIHLDINCDNMLLTKDYRVVKITDFSLSKSLPENDGDFVELDSVPESKYFPPEVKINICDPKSDIWCLGCCLEEMRIEQDDVNDAIRKITDKCKEDALEVRPTALELLNNAWLK